MDRTFGRSAARRSDRKNQASRESPPLSQSDSQTVRLSDTPTFGRHRPRVSQALRSPRSSPRRNQATRCSEDP